MEDVNRAVAETAERHFDEWLAYFWAMDRKVEVGDTHFKVLRFVMALDEACPVSRLLQFKPLLEEVCRRFSGQGYRCLAHIGHDDWVPVIEEDFQFVLQCVMLENERDHLANKLMVARLLEDPEAQEHELPKWLHYDQDLSWAHVVEEVLTFSQFFVSNQFRNLYQIRHFEAAFWRVVNLACGVLQLETYDDLVAKMPPRFQLALLTIPQDWQKLRQQEHTFRREDWQNCSRNCIRFCLHLLEMGGAPQ